MGIDLKLDVSRVDGDAVEMCVSDNGPGINEEIRKRIFEPFFTTRSGGTGLGLAVVRAVIQAHQGEICVKSRLGQGTSFILKLPLVQSESALASGLWRNSRTHIENSLQELHI